MIIYDFFCPFKGLNAMMLYQKTYILVTGDSGNSGNSVNSRMGVPERVVNNSSSECK